MFPLTFLVPQKGVLLFITHTALRCPGAAFRDHIRHVPWEDMFDLGASAAPTEYHE